MTTQRSYYNHKATTKIIQQGITGKKPTEEINGVIKKSINPKEGRKREKRNQ